MIFLLDLLSIVIPLVITFILYRIYYKLFIGRYIKKIRQAKENGEDEKAAKMKALALKRQPKRMKLLLKKYEI